MAKTKVNFYIPEEVVEYMKDARDGEQFNDRIAEVKAHYNNQYPSWWYPHIVAAGIKPPDADATDIELRMFDEEATDDSQ